MRLSNKHANVQTVTYRDFTGGLNTNDAPEVLQPNELCRAVNVEIYKGQLKTVSGTTKVYYQADGDYKDLVYDSIGNYFLLIDSRRNVYWLNNDGKHIAGQLTGDSNVAYAAWESGVLIASGGKLQYFHSGELETLSTSPDVCHGVFVKDGRVWVYYDDELKCSHVGDEADWEHDDSDESSAQWLQIGYKDGGYIVGVTSLSSDVIILKSNSHAYHLAGSFPSWQLSEIGRQISCKCYNACVALVNNTVCIGASTVQAISTTDSYGDMQATNIAQKVYGDILNLPKEIKPRYIPQLNQVWILQGTKQFIFYDVNVNAWYYRKFNSDVVDAVEANNHVYILKPTGLYVIDPSHMLDEDIPMQWSFYTQNLLSNNRFLIKRVRVDTTPFHNQYAEERFLIGGVALEAAQPDTAYELYNNNAYLYESQLPLCPPPTASMYPGSEELYNSQEMIYESDLPLVTLGMYRAEIRCVNNRKSIQVRGSGNGGITIFNSISYDIAEV